MSSSYSIVHLQSCATGPQLPGMAEATEGDTARWVDDEARKGGSTFIRLQAEG